MKKENQKLKKIGIGLAVLLFFIPYISAFIVDIGASPEDDQSGGIYFIATGLINSYFVIASISLLALGHDWNKNKKFKKAKKALLANIILCATMVIIHLFYAITQ